ncbi:hypothetical protein [Accumulibacter sp.]|uniref:hypothetical protein n=1 Tax=Accumulibacter sp. TaxID=2053492 RepID=UPI0038FC54E8
MRRILVRVVVLDHASHFATLARRRQATAGKKLRTAVEFAQNQRARIALQRREIPPLTRQGDGVHMLVLPQLLGKALDDGCTVAWIELAATDQRGIAAGDLLQAVKQTGQVLVDALPDFRHQLIGQVANGFLCVPEREIADRSHRADDQEHEWHGAHQRQGVSSGSIDQVGKQTSEPRRLPWLVHH